MLGREFIYELRDNIEQGRHWLEQGKDIKNVRSSQPAIFELNKAQFFPVSIFKWSRDSHFKMQKSFFQGGAVVSY